MTSSPQSPNANAERNTLKYQGQNYQFIPSYVRNRDPTNNDLRDPKNQGYYPKPSMWLNSVTKAIWLLVNTTAININVPTSGATWVELFDTTITVPEFEVLVGGPNNTIVGVGPGTSGQLLQSNGPGINPSFVDPTSDGASLVLIQSQTATNTASLAFTMGLTTYKSYMIVVSQVVPATGGQNFNMDFSNDGGATYIGANLACGLNYNTFSSATTTNVNSAATAPIAIAVSGIAFASATIYYTPGQVSYYVGQSTYFDSVYRFAQLGGSSTGNNQNINALEFSFASGNITSGTVSIYGIRNT